MNKNELMSQLSQLGFPLLVAEDNVNVNKTLSEVIKSRDLRLWEGFPVLLINAMEAGSFDYEAVKKFLKSSQDKANYQECVLISLAVYKYFHLDFSWPNQLSNQLAGMQKKKVDVYLEKLYKGDNISLSNYLLSSIRILNAFKNYFMTRASETKRLMDHSEDLSLEYALSQIFPAKQKELFLKKLKGEKMTKTEKEYFSRKVKKKVLALSNPELHRMAQKVISS